MYKDKSHVLNLIYPRRCPVCDDVVSMPFEPRFLSGYRAKSIKARVKTPAMQPGLICPDCAGKMMITGNPYCMRCGRRLSGKAARNNDEYCRDCMSVTHAFDRGWSVFRYDSAAESLFRFKYRGRREYASYYAAVAYRLYGGDLRSRGVQAIVPVPLFPAKKRRRGYNQSEVFARAFSKESGIPVRSDIIARVRNTAPQKGLSGEKRRFNVKNAFIIKKNDVELKCMVIVDDIYTTGSTVDEIASLLKRNGVREVYVLTIAAGTV